MPVDDAATRQALLAIAARVEAAGQQIAQQGAEIVRGAAMRKLHVGFGVVSGTMRRSHQVTAARLVGPGMWSASVGPTVIYARRFELGFVGTDSLGRRYDQRGRPYFKPAVNESRARIQALATRLANVAIRG